MRASRFEFWAQSFKQTAHMLGIVSLQQCLFAKIKHWGMNYLNNQCNKLSISQIQLQKHNISTI